jgi:hemerythrin-like domain-containing protein
MQHETRRRFLVGAAAAAVAGCTRGPQAHADPPDGASGEGVTPPEDLMREHGLLNHILLIYEDGIRRLASEGEPPLYVIGSSADVIRRFIEQYHEKLEEDHVFPRFEKANKLVDLVATLRRQHQAGRALTDTIRQLSTAGGVMDLASRQKLSDTMRLFIRMYRPHEAREDTVLFPAFRGVVTPKEFAALGDVFEDKEHELFGKAGFEGVVEQVAGLERALGIYDLNQFTPAT